MAKDSFGYGTEKPKNDTVSKKEFEQAMKNEFGIMEIVMQKGDEVQLNPQRENLQIIYKFASKNPDEFDKSLNKYYSISKEFITHLEGVINALDETWREGRY
jgi:hypothetical protein|tara:strand:+ start:33 stop:338 length:306 start_codon:yes stop_codon:yes gene_type:complete